MRAIASLPEYRLNDKVGESLLASRRFHAIRNFVELDKFKSRWVS